MLVSASLFVSTSLSLHVLYTYTVLYVLLSAISLISADYIEVVLMCSGSVRETTMALFRRWLERVERERDDIRSVDCEWRGVDDEARWLVLSLDRD